MLKIIWHFLRDPKNLAALTLIGGALAFLWKVGEFYLKSPAPPVIVAPAPVIESQNANATDGGTAFNAKDNATVIIDTSTTEK